MQRYKPQNLYGCNQDDGAKKDSIRTAKSSDRSIKTSVKGELEDSRSVSSGLSFLRAGCYPWSKRLVVLRKPRTPLLRLAKLQKYDEIIDILRDDSYTFKAWIRECSDKQRGRSALHLILEYRPTVKVVDLLIMRMRQVDQDSIPEIARDKEGMTPLHVAVARSCDVLVIEKFLCGKNASSQHNAAAIVDCQQRYPLHWACANPSSLFKPTISTLATDSTIENKVRAISCLVVAYPIASDSKDASGWTPKTMAKIHRADRRILQLLEFATELCRKQSVNVAAEQKDPHCSASNDATHASTYVASVVNVPVKVITSESFEDDFDMSSVGWDGDFDKGIFQRTTETTRGDTQKECDKNVSARDLGVPTEDQLSANSKRVLQNCWFV